MLAGLAVGAALGLAGCRGERSEDPPRQFFPDMDDSPKWKPQSQSQFFEDGRTMRPAVVGTVAFGDHPNDTREERARYLREDRGYYEGIDAELLAKAWDDYRAQHPESQAEGTGDDPMHAAHGHEPFPPQADVYLAYMPITPDEKVIARGRDRFNIYCATCHGYRGEGSVPDATGSPVGMRWSTPVPSYHDEKYRDRAQRTGKDGYIFHTARHGVANADPTKPPTMPAYGHALSEEDTWAVVAYIRVLQAMWTSDLHSVPMDEVKGERPPLPAPPPAAPAAPAQPGDTRDTNNPVTMATPAGDSLERGGAR